MSERFYVIMNEKTGRYLAGFLGNSSGFEIGQPAKFVDLVREAKQYSQSNTCSAVLLRASRNDGDTRNLVICEIRLTQNIL